MNRFMFVSLIVSVFCNSCGNNKEREIALPEGVLSVNVLDTNAFAFAQFTDKIELIKLKGGADIKINKYNELSVSDSAFFIMNISGANDSFDGDCNSIFKFDTCGNLLKIITSVSKGEVLRNFQINKDTIYAYSFPNLTIHKFSLNGDSVGKQIIQIEKDFLCAYKAENEYLAYFGACEKNNERITVFDNLGKRKKGLLFSSAHDLPWGITGNTIFYGEDSVSIVEPLYDQVYLYNKSDDLNERFFLNSGELNKKKEMLRVVKDGENDFDHLLQLAEEKFIINGKFMLSSDYIFAETFLNKEFGIVNSYYTLVNRNTGEVAMEIFNNNRGIFAGAFRFLQGKTLYSIVPAGIFLQHYEKLKSNYTLIENCLGAQSDINTDRDMILVKMILK